MQSATLLAEDNLVHRKSRRIAKITKLLRMLSEHKTLICVEEKARCGVCFRTPSSAKRLYHIAPFTKIDFDFSFSRYSGSTTKDRNISDEMLQIRCLLYMNGINIDPALRKPVLRKMWWDANADLRLKMPECLWLGDADLGQAIKVFRHQIGIPRCRVLKHLLEAPKQLNKNYVVSTPHSSAKGTSFIEICSTCHTAKGHVLHP